MSDLAFFSQLRADRRGGVSVLAALALTSVVGMAAFGVEATQGYAVKARNQRIADAAALAAAYAYAEKLQLDATSTPSAVLDPAAKAVAAANGVAAAAVTTTPVGLNQTSGNSKVTTVKVTVRTPVQLRLARLISSAASYNVASVATATVTQAASGTSTTTTDPNFPGCFFAIGTSANRGIWVSGAAQITAPTCNVMSARTLDVDGSARVTAGEITVAGNIEAEWSTDVVGTVITASGSFTDPRGAQNPTNPSIRATPDSTKKYSGRSVSVTDPLAGNTLLSAALAKTADAANFPIPTIDTLAAIPHPTGNCNWSFSGSTGSGCGVQSSWYANGKWTIPAGTYAIRNLTIGGSTIVEFQEAPVGSSNGVTVSGTMTVDGTTRLSVRGTRNDWRVMGAVSIIGSGNGAAVNSSGTWGAEFGDGFYHFGSTATFGKSVSFGNGKVVIQGDAKIGGSTTFRMGDGEHQFGGVLDIGGSSNVAVGAGALKIKQALTVGGSTTATFGQGNVTIGKTTAAYAAAAGSVPADSSIWLAGTTTVTFSGTSLANSFSTAGTVTQGCCNPLTFPSAANHFIGGTMTLNGAVNLAPVSSNGTVTAGAYTVRGSFIKSATQWLRGSGVSVFMSGNLDTSGASQANMTAATSTSTAAGDALVNILFASLTTTATTWNGSTQSTYTGMVYLPNADVTVSGAGTVTGCFGLVAKTITVNGSGAAGTKCTNVGTSAFTSTDGGTSGTGGNGRPVVRLVR